MAVGLLAYMRVGLRYSQPLLRSSLWEDSELVRMRAHRGTAMVLCEAIRRGVHRGPAVPE
jgi:hypothetical protein